MCIRVGVHVLWTPDSVIGACVLRTLASANMADAFFFANQSDNGEAGGGEGGL